MLVLSVLISCDNGQEKQAGRSNKKLEVVPARPKPINSPGEALSALKEGNARYNNGQFAHIHIKRVLENSEENAMPFATILSCADSEIPPEIIFDQENENLFVIRTRGNIVYDTTLSAIDSAARLSSMKIIVVLTHTDCKIVGGLIKKQADKSQLSDEEQKLLSELPSPFSADSTLRFSQAKAQVDNTIQQILNASPAIRDQVRQGKLAVTGAVYNDKTREVTYLDR